VHENESILPTETQGGRFGTSSAVRIVKSFDVFDTLVVRPFSPPQKLFLLVATFARKNHHVPIDDCTFERARVWAEKTARKKAGKREVTLEDIYAECRSMLELPKEDLAVLLSCEIELEIQLCRPIPAAQALLENARREGARVVFISDTYLPGSTLRAILARNGFWQKGDRLYVSCEEGPTKRSGELFRHVLESESIVASRMVHTGSHPNSDLKAPQRLGIEIEPFIQGNLNARENHLSRAKGFGPLLPGLLAGCSRLVRLGGTETPLQHQRLREAAAHAAGPFLSGFVLWVLQTARANGLKRLYFISRDGLVLLKVAKELASSVDPTIELCYLYGSRQAWHFPASRGIGLEKAPWLWEWTTSYSVATVLGRLGLLPKEVGSFLENGGIPPEIWNEPMSQRNEFKLKAVFLDPQFQKILRRAAEERRALLVAYLRQEGLFSGTKCAIVDVGWNGNLQDSLGAILEEEGQKPVNGFYVGLNHRRIRRERGERKTYLFDLRTDPKWRLPIPQPQSCIEVFCTANHGATVGYHTEGDTIAPLLRPWQTGPFEAWGLEVLQTVATAYAAELARVLLWMDSLNIDPLLAVRSLAFTWRNPTLEEAECLGSFPFTEDQVGIDSRPLARPLPWQHFSRIFKSRYSKLYRVIWIEGSLRLTPEPRRSLLRFANCIKKAGTWALSGKPQSGGA
jgi:FMN phosphatase YigB (HAD superfamily)